MSVHHSPNTASELYSSRTEQIQAWDWRWVVVSDWRPLFELDISLPLLSPGNYPGSQQLKSGAQRNVWRIPVESQTLVAKIFKPLSWRGMTKAALLGHPAQREFQAALYCLRRGLNVVRPVAYGQSASAGGAAHFALLTEEVAGAQPLSQYWLRKTAAGRVGTRTWENTVAEELASWLASLHERMVLPYDLHPGNILIREEQHRPVATLVDLHRMRYGKPVREIERLGNLSELNQWFRRNASGITRMRFLFDYLNHVYGLPSPRLVKRCAQDVMLLTNYNAAELQHKRDRRILGDNKYFGVLALPNRWQARVFLRARRTVEWSRCSQLRFSKQDWQAVLPEVVQVRRSSASLRELDIGAHRIPVQVVRNPEANDLLERWKNNHRQLNRHQRVPIPLALLERRSVGRTVESLLILEQEAHGRSAD